ncbi:(2Fe-2S)-binding protein [Bacillus sp. CHD6a]|uniref:(2Fe-2S)-binding protein n=1 Tax=Bacillus sp. CHD6a TaxID=1643452 RepID=UPI0006CC3FCA|nr:(2Fe-2S)-binding protein [Bacillus sp. CHD6a]KPB04176.1 hypothetical protein AAV98_13025 [Bacillus sp. CHD6a]
MKPQEQEWTWEHMENFFYMSNQEKADILWNCRITELEDPAILQKLIDIYGEGIKATTKDVTMMYLAGWFGYLCGAMHFLSADGCEINPDNIQLQVYKNHRGTMVISFYVNSEEIVETRDREWVEKFYKVIMNPVYKQMHCLSDSNNLLHMWYQATHSLYWISDRMKHSNLLERYILQYEKTVEMFKNVNPSTCMGVNTKKHPYAKEFIFIDNPWNLNDPLPLKPSCCLAYQTEGGHLCYTCPRMKKSERQEKFDKVLAEHSTTN